MSKALYRKYRSKSLAEIVGQDHVTGILAASLKKDIVSHAYLLTGPRGVGKTSIARILAHEINNLVYDDESTHLDIIEIDAASNNGVEDIRDLREKTQIAPSSAKFKIYIIDEVHMLSKPAFNALLKTLEEPPEHVVFILATTDADKLPATIISRTQQFQFRTITETDAVKHLAMIAKEEGIAIDTAALELIARHGDGSFRDSISLLDQLQSLAGNDETITTERVETILGLAPTTVINNLLAAYIDKNLSLLVELLADCTARGQAPSIIASQLIGTIRNRIIEAPQLVPLLDNLLDVAKSSNPSIKLLTILAAHAVPAPKSVALSSQAPQTKTISAPIAELERQATKAHPKMPKVVAPVEPEKPKQVIAPVEPIADQPFDWDKLIAETKANFVAIYSVLSKCDHMYDGTTLTIYTKNAFYKKKLDDAKHRSSLSKALQNIGAESVLLDTIASSKPLSDSQAAAVAAIMGGGEEVAPE